MIKLAFGMATLLALKKLVRSTLLTVLKVCLARKPLKT